MKVGDIKKFAIEKGNHICKVEIMEIRQIERFTMEGAEILNLYHCRRIENGTPVLAWATELT